MRTLLETPKVQAYRPGDVKRWARADRRRRAAPSVADRWALVHGGLAVKTGWKPDGPTPGALGKGRATANPQDGVCVPCCHDIYQGCAPCCWQTTNFTLDYPTVVQIEYQITINAEPSPSLCGCAPASETLGASYSQSLEVTTSAGACALAKHPYSIDYPVTCGPNHYRWIFWAWAEPSTPSWWCQLKLDTLFTGANNGNYHAQAADATKATCCGAEWVDVTYSGGVDASKGHCARLGGSYTWDYLYITVVAHPWGGCWDSGNGLCNIGDIDCLDDGRDGGGGCEAGVP